MFQFEMGGDFSKLKGNIYRAIERDCLKELQMLEDRYQRLQQLKKQLGEWTIKKEGKQLLFIAPNGVQLSIPYFDWMFTKKVSIRHGSSVLYPLDNNKEVVFRIDVFEENRLKRAVLRIGRYVRWSLPYEIGLIFQELLKGNPTYNLLWANL
jgi:hypothetical protein